MKRFLLLMLFVFAATAMFAQKEPPPPYKKTLTIPLFELRNIVDSSIFNNTNLDKTKRTIFIYFGPECGHCTVFTKRMMDSLDLFKNTQIIMVSSFAFDKIKKFYEENNIASCPFITMGQDKDYFFISHYGIRQFPSAYVYNKAGKFVKAYTSEINIFELAAEK